MFNLGNGQNDMCACGSMESFRCDWPVEQQVEQPARATAPRGFGDSSPEHTGRARGSAPSSC